MTLEWNLRQEVRGQARDIVAEGLRDVLDWLHIDVEPSLTAPRERWVQYLRNSNTVCPHPFPHHDAKQGFCGVCGRCWHRTIVREGWDIGFCAWCGEERDIRKW